MTTICSWCPDAKAKTLVAKTAGVSAHGICPCLAAILATIPAQK